MCRIDRYRVALSWIVLVGAPHCNLYYAMHKHTGEDYDAR